MSVQASFLKNLLVIAVYKHLIDRLLVWKWVFTKWIELDNGRALDIEATVHFI